MRFGNPVTLLLILSLLFCGNAGADTRRITRTTVGTASSGLRHALVIGNSAYQNTRPLKNPVNDARAMTRVLKGLGFQVQTGLDLSQKEMKRAILGFSRKIEKGGVGLFYFSGHGVRVGGSNYLIPVGAQIRHEEEVEIEAVDLRSVLNRMAAARNGLNIVILDACRDNPYRTAFKSGGARGLAQVTAPQGTFIAFATAPGSVAEDGGGQYGTYTDALLRKIKTPGLSIEKVFKQVRVAVVNKTGGAQVPWDSSSLMGDFYFVASAAGSGPGSPSPAAGEGYGPPESTDDQKTTDLLAKAEAHLKAGRLTTPKGSSAVDFYRQVLREEPANAQALDGLHRIVGTYVRLARNRIKAQDWGRAETYLNRAAGVSEADDRILAVRDELREAKAQATTTTTTSYVARTTTTTMSRPSAGGKSFTNSIGMKFVMIPGRDYYMGATEVTQSQWQAVMGGNPSYFKGGNRPVERVSWNDAQEFIRKLNAKEETNKYRLPTEAEWEHAARAGSSGDWCFGNDESLLEEYAWYDKNSGSQTHPVGQKRPNAWGLYDMHGNVWEWCQDMIDGRDRVCRGGSWYYFARNSRLAFRFRLSPDLTSGDLGFRLTRTK